MSLDFNFFQALEKNVIETGMCRGSGACVMACMFDVLTMDNQKPVLIEGTECTNCGMCLYICPVVSMALPNHSDALIKPTYLQARSLDTEIMNVNPTGGVVTSLSYAALQAGIKSIRTVKSDSNDVTKILPFNAYNKQDLLNATGSKFFLFPLTSELNDLRKQDIPSSVVIGLPCVISGINALQRYKYAKLHDIIKYKIGLFCRGVLDPIKFKSYLKTLNITSMNDIASVSFTKEADSKLVIELTSKKIITIEHNEWKQMILEACDYCKEYLTENSDISIGWMGVDKSGWQTIVVFTERGKKLVDSAIELKLLEIEPLSADGVEKLKEIQYEKSSKAKECII